MYYAYEAIRDILDSVHTVRFVINIKNFLQNAVRRTGIDILRIINSQHV